MFKHKIIAVLAVTSIFGLAACSGSSSDQKNETETTLRQKNSALRFTTLPATTAPRTVTTPMPTIGSAARPTTTVARPTTTVVRATATTVPKTVTTPMPQLPRR